MSAARAGSPGQSKYQAYELRVSGAPGEPTRITVQAWDLAGSHYPVVLERVVLQGVPFPAHHDALWALGRALDEVQRSLRE